MRRTATGVWATICLCLLTNLSRAAGNLCPDLPSHSTDSTLPSGLPSVDKLSDRALQVLNNRYALLNKEVERQAEKALLRMQKKELALQRQLQGKDSVKAMALFTQTRANYQQMLARLQSGTNIATGVNVVGAANPLRQYIPGVDSMQTALRFLGQISASGQPTLPGVPVSQVQNIESVSQQLLQLQGTMQNANEVQNFIREREQELKDQLTNSGVAKRLLPINQEAYYYQAQLSQYKDILNDPGKVAQTVLSAVRQAPAFQRFWQQNSYYSSLFPAPPPGVAGTPLALAGLQTRDQVQKEVQTRLGLSANATATQAADKASNSGGGSGGLAYLQQQVQKMETQLQVMKSTLLQYGTGSATGLSNGNRTTPDFQPNSQHYKTFLKRLQYSLVVQNSPSTAILPAISSLGLNVGYKLSDKATAGIGGSYLLGLGYGLKDIHLSNQGVGLRSFLDIKAKGSIWVSSGFEYNYLQQFTSLQNIPNIEVWQRSALIGLTKKYRIGKRENNLQLLYDLLANTETPHAQPFVFRLGWGF